MDAGGTTPNARSFEREALAPIAAPRSSTITARGLAETCDLPGRIHLTRREIEVLLLLAEGLPNKLICRRLNISSGTVKIHVSRVLAELGVCSRLQAVIAAQRLGLLDGAAPALANSSHDPTPVERGGAQLDVPRLRLT